MKSEDPTDAKLSIASMEPPKLAEQRLHWLASDFGNIVIIEPSKKPISFCITVIDRTPLMQQFSYAF